MTIFSPVNQDEIFSPGSFNWAETHHGLKFLSCNSLPCFNRILSLGRAEISAWETGMKPQPGLKTFHVINPASFLQSALESKQSPAVYANNLP
jgi:hypothetical protein